MTGAASWLSVPAVPVRVALSVWAGGAAAVGLALLLLGAEGGARAEAPVAVASPVVMAVVSRPPPGRSEAGEVATSRGHVRASLPFRNDASIFGWGTVRLHSEPTADEVTVRTIIDAPTAERRWATRCDVVLRLDGDEVRAPAQPAGTPMKAGGFYDALRLELGIDTLRRMSSAESVTGDVCGDPLEITPAQRATIRGFVERFDALALPVAPSVETEPELAPVDPEELVEDPDAYLEPA